MTHSHQDHHPRDTDRENERKRYDRLSISACQKQSEDRSRNGATSERRKVSSLQHHHGAAPNPAMAAIKLNTAFSIALAPALMTVYRIAKSNLLRLEVGRFPPFRLA